MATSVRETLLGRGIADTIELDGGLPGDRRQSPFERIREERSMMREMMLDDTLDAEVAQRKAAAERERVKAEADTFEITARLAELRKAVNDSGGGGNNEIMLAILQMMQSDKAQLIEQNKETRTMIDTVIDRLARATATETRDAKTTDDIDVVTKNISTMKAMMDAVATLFPQAVPGQHQPATIPADIPVRDRIELMRAEAEIKRTDMKAAESHAERMAEWELRRSQVAHEQSLKDREYETSKKRVDSLAGALERAGPVLMNVFGDVAKSRFGAPGAAAAAAVREGMAAPAEAPVIGQVACTDPACGQQIPVHDGERMVSCPRCHVMYQVGDDGT